jgi:hypothetical protein
MLFGLISNDDLCFLGGVRTGLLQPQGQLVKVFTQPGTQASKWLQAAGGEDLLHKGLDQG